MAADPQVAEKGQIQENRDFSLPCISHNVHYTKQVQLKREAALLSFCQIFGSFCGCYSVYTRPLLRRWTYYQYVQAFNLCLR